MTRKAILFDLDGTLVHTTMDYAQRCFTEAFGCFDITPSDAQCRRLWFGGDRDQQVMDLGVDLGAFWSRFQEIDKIENRLKHTSAYPDVPSLEQLREAGYALGVVTNAPPYVMDEEVLLTGVRFDEIVSTFGRFPSKPAPDALLYCLRRLDVKPADAWYVGNGEEDVLAAKAAGVRDVFLDRREYANGHVDASVRIYGLDELEALVVTGQAENL